MTRSFLIILLLFAVFAISNACEIAACPLACCDGKYKCPSDYGETRKYCVYDKCQSEGCPFGCCHDDKHCGSEDYCKESLTALWIYYIILILVLLGANFFVYNKEKRKFSLRAATTLGRQGSGPPMGAMIPMGGQMGGDMFPGAGIVVGAPLQPPPVIHHHHVGGGVAVGSGVAVGGNYGMHPASGVNPYGGANPYASNPYGVNPPPPVGGNMGNSYPSDAARRIAGANSPAVQNQAQGDGKSDWRGLH
eukprot:TRINITY_DN9227_c0_g1_i1.p1 TRINITY_DN9227_c0_g1~~TRINITY_DN9227_c0_g1_i1.p1  ORF type:complete len:249 (+),score=30.85 TRINITY_DN9227_c0_g1_i1:142-888(+)